MKRYAARLEVTVLDGDAVPNRVTVPAGEVAIGPGERVTVPLAVKIGQLASSVTIELAGDGPRLPAAISARRRTRPWPAFCLRRSARGHAWRAGVDE